MPKSTKPPVDLLTHPMNLAPFLQPWSKRGWGGYAGGCANLRPYSHHAEGQAPPGHLLRGRAGAG